MSAPSGNSPERRPAPTPIRLFQVWESADQRVPFPSLISLIARPGRDQPALRLEHLHHVAFVYRVTDSWVADLEFADGAFGTAALRAQSYSFRLTPIPGRFGLMPPSDAEQLLELHLERKTPKFWSDFLFELSPSLKPDAKTRSEGGALDRYRKLPWHSLRLEQPFGAGFGEPFYKFRKRDSRYEFWVGARTGDVRDELAPDNFPSLPPPTTSP